jgi:hypothetical protein
VFAVAASHAATNLRSNFAIDSSGLLTLSSPKITINMLMLVKQNSFTHQRVLLVLTDRGILAQSNRIRNIYGLFYIMCYEPPLGLALDSPLTSSLTFLAVGLPLLLAVGKSRRPS